MMPTKKCSRRGARWGAAATLLVLGASALGVTHLRPGDKPPDVSFTDVEGQRVFLAAFEGRPVVLLFGELYHARSLEACRQMQRIMADPRVAPLEPTCFLIIAQQAESGIVRDLAKEKQVPFRILHDRDRAAFAAYRVTVLPSVVVLDSKGRVVHAFAGLAPSFGDVVTDAILLAGGKLNPEQFARTLHPSSAPADSEATRRAARLTELARQLARSNMHELAADKFREALAADGKYVPARIGLGRHALDRGRLADADEQFKAALALDPNSTEALLGSAYVRVMRGGPELGGAERQVRNLLVQRPNDPEVHFLLGLIQEKTDRMKAAAASYKKAAELALQHGGRE